MLGVVIGSSVRALNVNTASQPAGFYQGESGTGTKRIDVYNMFFLYIYIYREKLCTDVHCKAGSSVLMLNVVVCPVCVWTYPSSDL